jgi:hypothetical protein
MTLTGPNRADLEKRAGRDAANRLYLASGGRQFESNGNSAAPKCSNQADLRLTLADLFPSSNLPG